MGYGDSKTAGSGDSTPPPVGENGYPPILTGLLAVSREWRPVAQRIAHSGFNVAQLQAAIDSDLVAQPAGTDPNYVLVNMGVNDAQNLPAEVVWEANYGYVLDAFHTKWPNAWIGCMRVWKVGFDAGCDTLATWLNVVLSTRPWAYVGPDERIFLKGADNGVTMLNVDGVHPNRLGYIETAVQWKASMGLG